MSFEFVISASPAAEAVSASLSLSLALLMDSSGRVELGLLESGWFVRYCSICEKALAMVLRGDREVVAASVTFGRGKSGIRDRDAEIPARRI